MARCYCWVNGLCRTVDKTGCAGYSHENALWHWFPDAADKPGFLLTAMCKLDPGARPRARFAGWQALFSACGMLGRIRDVGLGAWLPGWLVSEPCVSELSELVVSRLTPRRVIYQARSLAQPCPMIGRVDGAVAGQILPIPPGYMGEWLPLSPSAVRTGKSDALLTPRSLF